MASERITDSLSLSKTLENLAAKFPANEDEQRARQREYERREREQAERQLEERRANYASHLLAEMGPRYAADRVALERWEVYHPAQEEVLARVREIAGNLLAFIQAGNGLILYGPCGTGKDHLLAALLHRAAGVHGIQASYVNGQDFFAKIRERMDSGGRQEDVFHALEKPRVLAISDLIPPAREPTAWNLECVYRIVDFRYRHLKPTWVTLNAASIEEADEKLSAPVFDRLREGATVLPCFWPSYRMRKTA